MAEMTSVGQTAGARRWTADGAGDGVLRRYSARLLALGYGLIGAGAAIILATVVR